MPYNRITELPKGVKNHLPKHAQEIYKKTFNSAWDQYKDPKDNREEVSHRVAWSAVKHDYEKGADGDWHKKSH